MTHRTVALAVVLAILAPQVALAQRVEGVLMEKASSRPIAEVRVTLLQEGGGDSASVLTDEDGEFRFVSKVPGMYRLRVRKIGLSPVETHAFWLGPLSERTAVLRLEMIGVALDTVRITARGLPITDWTKDFFERQRTTHGIFLTRSEMVTRQPIQATDWLFGVRGVSVQVGAGRSRVVPTRGGGRCAFDVFIDNAPLADTDLNMVLRSDDIAAMEVYPSAADAPLRYRPRGCGVLLVWTRSGRGDGEVTPSDPPR